MSRAAARPTVAEIQTLCQRVRAAGSPAAPPRSRLVGDYRRAAGARGVPAQDVATGYALVRATAALLRAAAEAAATRHPSGPTRPPR